MELKDIIKLRRDELGLTLQDIADYIGVSKATVQRYESGEIINLKQSIIYKLSQALKISPSYLMGWDNIEFFKNEDFKYSNVEVVEDNKELLLLDNYRKLNDLGQHEATKRVQELTYVDKYKKAPEYLQIIAAHNDNDSQDQQEKMQRDIEKLKNRNKDH